MMIVQQRQYQMGLQEKKRQQRRGREIAVTLETGAAVRAPREQPVVKST